MLPRNGLKSKPALNGTNVLGVIGDIFGAIVLGLYALIIGPLGVLRGPIAIERIAWYLWVMLPQGQLSRAIRMIIDWRVGRFEAAIAQLESLVSLNEEYYKAKTTSRTRKRVLEDIYTLLARAYLHVGHMDDAMLVVIRAKKSLGLDRLGGLAGIDAKTAHLVRAGLAAGRLLDGGGLATMFVRSGPQDSAKRFDESAKPRASDGDGRQGAQASEPGKPRLGATTTSESERSDGAKIIPFPPGRDGQPLS